MVVEATHFEGVLTQVFLAVAEPKTANGSEKASFKNHLDVEGVFHALKVIGWVLDHHG